MAGERAGGKNTSLTHFLSRNAPWLAAGGLLTFLSSFGQTFFISIFAGEIRTEFGLGHGTWGGIYSIGTMAAAIVMIRAGALSDVMRVRSLGPVILFGLAGACIAMAVNPWVWALPGVIFLLRLFGQSMTSHIAMVAMARWFVATRGRALSIASLGVALGEATLPITFVAILGVIDWRLLWWVAALVALAGVPVLMRLLRLERTPRSMATSRHSTGMGGRHWTRAQVLGHPLFWLMIPALLGPSAFHTAFFFHQVHFAEIKGWAHVALVAFFPVYTAMSIAALIGSGWALDRFGTARLMPWYQLPMVGAFVAFSLATGPVGAFLGFFCLALTSGGNNTLPNAFWAEIYGTANIGSIRAMIAAVMVLGSAIGPGITGVFIDLGIGLETQFLWIAGYFLFATALMYFGVARARAAF